MVPRAHPSDPFNNPTVKKPEFLDLNITIVLISPETSGNVGAICRIMKNFGFYRLILFQPACNPLDDNGYGFAMHASDILENAEIIQCSPETGLQRLHILFERFDMVIGTSAKGVDKSNIKRIPLFLHELDINLFKDHTKIALVFGRESTGLTNDEILLTDFCLKIATDDAYPTLNLSQAVTICLYSIYLSLHSIGRGKFTPATKVQKDRLLEIFHNIAQNVPIEKFRLDRATVSFKNLIGRGLITWKEANLLYSFFRKIDYLLAGEIPIHPEVKSYQIQDSLNSDDSRKNISDTTNLKPNHIRKGKSK